MDAEAYRIVLVLTSGGAGSQQVAACLPGFLDCLAVRPSGWLAGAHYEDGQRALAALRSRESGSTRGQPRLRPKKAALPGLDARGAAG